MRLRRVAAASVALFALLLSGCVVIPTSGGVIEGDPIGDAAAPSSVLLPQRPEQDADQRSILQGFLRAGTGPQSDYAVAREYLAEPMADRWDPVSGVVVGQAGSESFSQAGPDVLEYSVVPLATVDAEGRYTELESAPAITMRFRFVEVDGQWRIVDAPHGTVLTASAFALIFSSYSLQFYDPTLRHLVPDERWYPTTSVGVLTRRIVRALLAGPTEWLAPAVSTAFPSGTTLGGLGVRLLANRAIVDLSEPAGAADAEQLQRMQVQLEQSLVQVRSVDAVSMTVEGAELVVPGPVEVPAPVTVDPRSLVVDEGVFGYLQGEAVQPIEAVSAAVTALSPSAVAWSAGVRTAAVLTAEGVWAVTPDAATLVDARESPAEPSVDGLGYLWSAPSAEPAALQAFGADGAAQAIATALPDHGRLRVIEVARDDARIALLTEVDGATELVVAGIIRDNGVPVALGALHRIPTGAAQVLDLAWVDSGSIATLDLADGQYRITRHAIGGMSESLGRLSFATRIVGGNGVDGLRALGESGTIYQPQGSSWQSTGRSVDLLVTRR